MAIITLIAFGYASTMPVGPANAEYLRMFGYDPSWYGIALIFMISGWLAMKSLTRHGSALKFLGSRFFRNIPILIIFAAFVPMVLFPLFGQPPEPGTSRVSQHLSYFLRVVSCIEPDALTPGLLDNALYMCIIQGGLWTFRWGMIAFLATAGLWVISGLKNRLHLLLYTVLVTSLYVALVDRQIRGYETILDFAVTASRLGMFYLMGMCAFAYREKLSHSLRIPVILLCATLVEYFFLPWTPLIEVTATLALAYLAYYGITSSRTVPNWLKKAPDLSLGLYVINWPMAQIMLLNFPGVSPLGLFFVSFPATILASYAIWHLINRNTEPRLADWTSRTA
ncbi:MAG: acyltransferase family protein [Hyphomonadaceae bacterium]|nr:acyltransferase family protein [Hyphomonadaceae bacterium]